MTPLDQAIIRIAAWTRDHAASDGVIAQDLALLVEEVQRLRAEATAPTPPPDRPEIVRLYARILRLADEALVATERLRVARDELKQHFGRTPP